MRIQYVGKIDTQFESNHEITYTQLDKPSSLDVFDINIFSLQDINMFVCETGEIRCLDCTNDLRSIREMIVESKSAVNIIAIVFITIVKKETFFGGKYDALPHNTHSNL